MIKAVSTARMYQLYSSECQQWVAWTDEVSGAVTQGRTLREARENLKDAIALMLEPLDQKRLSGDALL